MLDNIDPEKSACGCYKKQEEQYRYDFASCWIILTWNNVPAPSGKWKKNNSSVIASFWIIACGRYKATKSIQV